MKLTDGEIGYIAGMIDGEGTIQLMRLRKYHNIKPLKLHPELSISNTDKECLIFIKNKLKVGYIVNRRRNEPNRSDLYTYVITKRLHIIKILQTVLPYLRIKKLRGKLLLDYLLSRENRTQYKKSHVSYNEYELEIEWKLKKLNKRGINNNVNIEPLLIKP